MANGVEQLDLGQQDGRSVHQRLDFARQKLETGLISVSHIYTLTESRSQILNDFYSILYFSMHHLITGLAAVSMLERGQSSFPLSR